MKKTVIVDYRLGNIFSVKQACDTVGIKSIVSSEREMLMSADALILPGVGAFGEAMDHLKDLRLVEVIKDHVNSNKPLFGICLGLQLLFTESIEFGVTKGLDIIPGKVTRIPENANQNRRIIPHVGWNQVELGITSWENYPLLDTQENEYFYFVHSYFVSPSNPQNILGITEYEGFKFCSVATSNRGNVFATQFHPEKSGEKGLEIYRNWAKLFELN